MFFMPHEQQYCQRRFFRQIILLIKLKFILFYGIRMSSVVDFWNSPMSDYFVRNSSTENLFSEHPRPTQLGPAVYHALGFLWTRIGKLHLMLAYQQLLSSFSSQHQSTHLQTLVQFTHSHLRLIAPMCHISLKSFDSINRTSVLAVKKSSNSALTQFLSSRNFVCFLESYVLGPSLLHIVPHCLWTRDQSGHILFMTRAEARRTSPST